MPEDKQLGDEKQAGNCNRAWRNFLKTDILACYSYKQIGHSDKAWQAFLLK